MHRRSRFPLHVGSSLVAAFLCALLPSYASAGAPQPLSECNSDLAGDYYLTADLDCSGGSGPGVGLTSARARLELRGFTIRASAYSAVECSRSCTILGPGTLENSAYGIRAQGAILVDNVTIRDNHYAGVESTNGRDSGRVEVRSSDISGGDYGIVTQSRAILVDSTVTGALGSGVVAGGAYKWRSGQALRGVHCGRGRTTLVNSIVENNFVDPDYPSCDETHPCGDVVSCFVPELDETSGCGTSGKYNEAGTHGVCSLD